MAWIELHQTMNKHRKTLRLASLLNISRREAVGLLCDLWLWAVDNADAQGRLEGLSAEDIGAALDMSKRESAKVVAALLDTGYLNLAEGCYVIHDWYDYCGKLNEKRATDRRRKAESKANSNGIPTEFHRKSTGIPLVTVPNLTVPIVTNVKEGVGGVRDDGADAPPLPPKPTKPERHEYGEYRNVLLTDEDMDKLRDEYPTDWQQRIDRLSEYMKSKGATYKDHLATIRAWAKKDKAGKPGKKDWFREYDESGKTELQIGPDLLAEARAKYG